MQKETALKIIQFITIEVIFVLLTTFTAYAELKIESVYPALGKLGENTTVTLKGKGFDENTRVSMSLDIGNKMKIIGSAESPGFVYSVTVIGRYAYIACGNYGSSLVWSGLQIIDVKDPSNPVRVGSVETPGHANDVAVVGNMAYVVCGDSHDNRFKGLEIIDVTNPEAPFKTGSVETPGFAKRITVADNIASILIEDDNGENGLQIDVSNASAPAIIGSADISSIDYVIVGNTAYSLSFENEEQQWQLEVTDLTHPYEPSVIGSVKITGTYIGRFVVIEDKAYIPYAMCKSGGGLQVVDVSNPSNPAVIGSIDTGFSTNVTVIGNLAYVTCGDYIYNEWNGLQIIDISNPHDPNLPGSINIPLNIGNAYDIKVAGNIAYLTSDSDLQIIDVTNPVKPLVIGSTDVGFGGDWIKIYKDRAYVRGWDNIEVIDISNPANPEHIGYINIPADDIVVTEKIAYVTTGNELKILELSSLSNPEFIGAVDIPGSAVKVATDKDKAYVCYWVDNELHGGLQIADVSNASNPKLLGSVDTPDAAEIVVIGNTAYMACGIGGLKIIDISDPFHPKIISYVDTSGVAADVTIVDNIAYVADWHSGLQAIDISNSLKPVIIGSVNMPTRSSGIEVVRNIAYITDWEKGLIILPVPVEIKNIIVNNGTSISLEIPDPKFAGHYTLKVFNREEKDELTGAITFVPPEESYILNTKAIIVAGGGPDAPGEIWEETKESAECAYNALLYQGYTAESIYYISADKDSDRVDGTYENLPYAVRTWTAEYPAAGELLIFFADHGKPGAFFTRYPEELSADDIAGWLDDLQTMLSIPVIFIYDACYSGSFLSQLKPSHDMERILITSTLPQEQAYMLPGGLSFSYQFWNSVHNGSEIGKAFSYAKTRMTCQTALIDANGNGIANEPEDNIIADNLKVRRGYKPETDIPYIYDVSAPQTLSGKESCAKIQAGVSYVEDKSAIRRVWAVITPPDFNPSPDMPVSELPAAELQYNDEQGIYEGIYENFTAGGTYIITVYAMNTKGVYSLPREIRIEKAKDYIDTVSPDQFLYGKSFTALWACVSQDIAISRVWAEIEQPDSFKRPPAELYDRDNDGIYEGIFDGLDTAGTYTAAIYAADTDGNMSLSVKTYITQNGTDAGGDMYEDDNSFRQAEVVIMNDSSFQEHNFHKSDDEDWLKFYGLADKIYTFEINNLHSGCDTVIEVFDTDGMTELASSENENTAGGNNFLNWICIKDGVYYVRLTNFHPYFGKNTKYNFKAYISVAPPHRGKIEGIVKDAVTGAPIHDAKIKTDGNGSALSRPPDGGYTIVQEPGNWTVTVEASGYDLQNKAVTVKEGVSTFLNISLIPSADINSDGKTDLADAVASLQVIAGMKNIGGLKRTDINGDGKIGLEEAVYIIEKVTGLRN